MISRIRIWIGALAVLLCVALAVGAALPVSAFAEEEEFFEEGFSGEEPYEPDPTEEPTPKPTPKPTEAPTPKPTPEPTKEPTPTPTEAPTEEPEPTEAPTQALTETPTPKPTEHPTATPEKKEKEVFEHGYATLRIDADVYEDASLNTRKYVGRFVEADAVVYCLAREEGKKDDVILITFAVKKGRELELLEGWIRAWNVYPVPEKELKALDKQIREDDYALYDEDDNGEDEKDVALPPTPFRTAEQLNAAAEATEKPAEETQPAETAALPGEPNPQGEQTEQADPAEENAAPSEQAAEETGNESSAETDELAEKGVLTAPDAPSEESEQAEEENAAAEARSADGVDEDETDATDEDAPAEVVENQETGEESSGTDAVTGETGINADEPEVQASEAESSEESALEEQNAQAGMNAPSGDSASEEENAPQEGLTAQEAPEGDADPAEETGSLEAPAAAEETRLEETAPTEEGLPEAKEYEEGEVLDTVPGDESFLTEEEMAASGVRESVESEEEEPEEEELVYPEGFFADAASAAPEGESVPEDGDTDEEESDTGEPEESGIQYLPARFAPRVALSAEAETDGEAAEETGIEARSFTLSADSYNPEGAELGEVKQVTLAPGEEAAFDEITFKEAGTYGFAILDDAQEEFPWELTVVVGENPDMEQLYIDTTQTVYARANNLTLTNDAAAAFEIVPRDPETDPKPVTAKIDVKKKILPSGIYEPVTSIDPGPTFSLIKGNSSVSKVTMNPIKVGDMTGSISIPELSFNEPGIYEYIIEEQDDSKQVPFIEYLEDGKDDEGQDARVTKKRSVKVVVTKDETTGELKVDVDEAEFENQYLTAPLTINLNVESFNPGDDETKEFSVVLSVDVPSSFFNGYEGASGSTLTFKLKHGGSITVDGLPVGTTYNIVAKPETGYTYNYTPGTVVDEGVLIKDTNEHVATITVLGKESVSKDLDTWLLLYGYSYKDDGTNTYYYYPNTNANVKIELIAPDDAPPFGWDEETPIRKRTNGGEFKFSGAKYPNKYRSLRIPFTGITFTSDETLTGIHKDKEGIIRDADGNEVSVTFPEFDDEGNLMGRTFIYTVRQTAKNYSYIDYDIHRDYQTQTEYKVYIHVYRDSDGKLQADIEPVGTVTSVPMFEDEYRATSLSVAKSVSGTGASSTQEFRVRVTLERRRVESDEEGDTVPDSDDWVPLRNWQFVAAYGTMTTSDGTTTRKFSGYRNYRTASDGSVTLTLKHRDYIMLHGVPDGIRYSIEEADYESQHYWPRYSISVGSKSKERYNEIIDIDADGQRIVNCVILNIYSLVPITGHGDPARRTIAMAVCLSIALACEIGRRKLRRREREEG